MLRVGLTGGIGSGKSLVANFFKQLGICIVDADSIARSATPVGSPLLEQIATHFGSQVLTASGELNRSYLRSIVFNDREQRLALESLVHPVVRAQIEINLQNAVGDYVILESPLLFETRQSRLVNKIIVVDVPEALQLERAGQRDHAHKEEIAKIMAVQTLREERLANADFVIDNSSTIEATKTQVYSVHQALLQASMSFD